MVILKDNITIDSIPVGWVMGWVIVWGRWDNILGIMWGRWGKCIKCSFEFWFKSLFGILGIWKKIGKIFIGLKIIIIIIIILILYYYNRYLRYG